MAESSQTQSSGSRLIEPSEALELVRRTAAPSASETLPLNEVGGLVLAETVTADRDYPPFPRAMMDGYAVRVEDAGKPVPVAGEIAAGGHAAGSVEPGRCYEIMTGAACPRGTEAIVEKERVRRAGTRVHLPRKIVAGQHIASRGSECPVGRVVLSPHEVIRELHVGVMASFGVSSVEAVPRPKIAVITTGGELVHNGQHPGPVQIRDSNGPMLTAMARRYQLPVTTCRHAGDNEHAIVAALEESKSARIVVISGGVSVGTYDLVPAALKAYGAEVIFHRVRQKPGKPLLFARKGTRLFFGLPGNPLVSHFCFHRYVMAAAERMAGKTRDALSGIGKLGESIQPKPGRTFFMTGSVKLGGPEGLCVVRPLPGVSSADIFRNHSANCYIEIPPGRELISAGSPIAFSRLREE